MTEHLFPDNTVLCNFAAVDRLDLLKSALGGRGRWTEAVAYEASRSAVKLPPLRRLPMEGWLDEPIEITNPADVQKIARIRRAVFGGTDDQPLKHLGEAQTCYVIKNWASFAGSWWISDDREAIRYAKFQNITTRETIDIFSIAVADGEISATEAFSLMQQMADADRHLRLPKSAKDFRR
jgi:predicted nucleic acid-binding protein